MSRGTLRDLEFGSGHRTVHSGEQRWRLLDLCLHYWEVVYAYMRHHCDSEEEARALTVAFFRSLHTRVSDGVVDCAKGRFRQFLLRELQRFIDDTPPCGQGEVR